MLPSWLGVVTLCLPRRFLNKDLGFACGGSGSLFKTENGGKTWKREKVEPRSP